MTRERPRRLPGLTCRAVGSLLLIVVLSTGVVGGWCGRRCEARGVSQQFYEPAGEQPGGGSPPAQEAGEPAGAGAETSAGSVAGPVTLPCVDREGRLFVALRPLADIFGWFIQLEAQGTTVTVNGFPLQALLVDGRSHVQVRELASLMGLDLAWDEAARAATLRVYNRAVILKLSGNGNPAPASTPASTAAAPSTPTAAPASPPQIGGAAVNPVSPGLDAIRQRGPGAASTPDGDALALTFDDGPQAAAVQALLDVLAEYRVKATFFLVGHLVEAYPGLVMAVSRAGHDIGNHSYSHPHLSTLPDELIRAEIVRTQEAVRAVTGRFPTLFRPPYGDYDQRVRRIAEEQGCRMVLWDVNSDDWNDPDPRAVVDKVVRRARGGCVILLHTRVSTSRILPGILDGLLRRNLRPMGLERLLETLAPGRLPPRQIPSARP